MHYLLHVNGETYYPTRMQKNAYISCGTSKNLTGPVDPMCYWSYGASNFLEVVVQTTTYIQFAFVVLHSRGGSWELVDAFSLCCLTWHFWKILGE